MIEKLVYNSKILVKSGVIYESKKNVNLYNKKIISKVLLIFL